MCFRSGGNRLLGSKETGVWMNDYLAHNNVDKVCTWLMLIYDHRSVNFYCVIWHASLLILSGVMTFVRIIRGL